MNREEKGSDTGRRLEVAVTPDRVLDALRWAKEEGFDHFIGMNSLDLPMEAKMEIFYFLDSVSNPGRFLVIRTSIPRDDPVLPSAREIYPLAEYQEIELYEFFGIRFDGNPSLRKWITDENWEGPPPLRKDVDTRKMVLEMYYGGKRYERPVQERGLQGGGE